MTCHRTSGMPRIFKYYLFKDNKETRAASPIQVNKLRFQNEYSSLNPMFF